MTSAILPTVAAAIAASVPVDRSVRLAQAAEPAPATVERGPVARLHWRHGLDVDPALAACVVDTPETPREWSSILAETHATLLDPSGNTPVPNPSHLGSVVSERLQAAPEWPMLSDAARAIPMFAREAVTSLANVVLDALKQAGAKATTDTRRSASDLEAARRAVEEARAAVRAARTGTREEQKAAALAEAKALETEMRARAAVAVDDGICKRAGDVLDDTIGQAVAALATKGEERNEAQNAFDAALGNASGVGGQRAIADDVLRAITPRIARMLRAVGAIRHALASGRAARHVRGREGMVGVTHGGIEHAADLTAVSLAGLAGHLGAPMSALTRLALVEGRADVTEKGGGLARNGDVVVVVDQSGSMRGVREEWASALALAVILEARADNRNVSLITYNGRVRASIVVDSAASFAKALAALTLGSTGDNNEHAALTEAAAALARMPHGGDPADILIITDGQWLASNTAGVNIDRARLRGCFIGGVAPVGMGFASTWEVRGDMNIDNTGAVETAVTIAEVIV